ncbi:MAG: glycosyltransferase [Planctomycetota bacterium]
MSALIKRGFRRALQFNQTLKEQGVGLVARVILVMQKVKRQVLPPGTARLAFYRKTLGRISGPILHYAYRSWRLAESQRHPDGTVAAKLNFEEAELLTFAQPETPVVSILIPVYDQWRITYGCLRSILSYTGDKVSYEVLILDDNSQDETKRLHEKTSGVRYIRNERNLRFLLNCNRGATFARGEHILLLNNDTLVHTGWLEAMVERLESDHKIGLVGAKLLGADGLLQEAGGIIFRDGSGWNYGRGQNPNHPSFTFFKDTDFCSGACVLISKSLWDELGGFDERFAPAYYEDADLAFAVRAAGYRTVYEPKAVVTHLEGISHGTDVSTGLKKYQVENQAKFEEKWRDTLRAEQAAGPEELNRAQCRGTHRPCVFIADYQIPQWENEAGLRLTWMYIQLFLDLGYRVIFHPANLFPVQPYTAIMEAAGVEVLHGPEFLDMDTWFKKHGKDIDFAYLSRWEVAAPFMKPLRSYTSARIVFQVVDLHHLREQRSWENLGKVGRSPEAVRQKKIEYQLIEESDVIHTPSTYEAELMKRDFPHKRILDIPIFFYEELPDYSISLNACNLLFVGGYGHPPNEDAVKWFHAEILPKVLASHPNVKVHLVGGGAGSEIKTLASSVTRLHGRISDEALADAYKMADIAVVPLRFGAGVKGKVVEAMANGLPVVTTSIGAEGIPETGRPLVVGDTANEIASRILALLQNASARSSLAEQGQAFVGNYYSRKRAIEILNEDFPYVREKGKLENEPC